MALSYQKAREALDAGDRLMVTHPDPNKATDRTIYALVSSGKTISAPAYRKLYDNLAPMADGLFGTAISQTYSWRA